MSSISALIFCRNDIGKAIGLINDLYNIVDEIVVVDSSDAKDAKKLMAKKKSENLTRLIIHHAIALGLADPLFTYGVNRCRSEWVLLMGTDERLSPALKKDLGKLIGTGSADAFTIRNYIMLNGRQATDFVTWQIRIFKKNKATFKGLLHEQPAISGTVERLEDEKYCIKHYVVHLLSGKSSIEYDKLEKYERFTYRMFNDKIAEYFYEKNVLGKGEREKSLLGLVIIGALVFYEKLTLKKPNQELTNIDYRLFYSFKYRPLLGQTNDNAIRKQLIDEKTKRLRDIEQWKKEPNSQMVLEISKIIHDIGITKFLGLDKDTTVAQLTLRYKNRKHGIKLLMELLEKKYKNRYMKKSST
ncbi:MAG: hypothetical protein KGH69_02080 [Candidatus Micrarchaeota archaeon]|nr:hypothetical protein [Candidatus Micrarchaeota archaeon]